MKKNDPNPEVLDDNYFPKQVSPSSSFLSNFFKVAGYTILNTVLFAVLIVTLADLVFPLLPKIYFGINKLSYLIIFLSWSPFFYHLYRAVQDKNPEASNWRIWTCLLTFILFAVFSLSISIGML